MFLRDRTNLFTGRLRLLHFAPEKCLRPVLSALPNLDYVTADLRPGRAMVVADVTAIPFADGAFDAVLCSHVLEHVPDDRRAMREIYRVLTPGGWAVVLVPLEPGRAQTYEDPTITSPEDRARSFGSPNHVRVYGRDYKDRLADAGFTVEVDRYAERLPPEVVQTYGLKRHGEIYFCTKAA